MDVIRQRLLPKVAYSRSAHCCREARVMYWNGGISSRWHASAVAKGACA